MYARAGFRGFRRDHENTSPGSSESLQTGLQRHFSTPQQQTSSTTQQQQTIPTEPSSPTIELIQPEHMQFLFTTLLPCPQTSTTSAQPESFHAEPSHATTTQPTTSKAILSKAKVKAVDSSSSESGLSNRARRQKRNRLAKGPSARDKSYQLRRLCKHVMAIEFSLTYHLSVIMCFSRIMELCDRYYKRESSMEHFYNIFNVWSNPETPVWIRFDFQDMVFITVPQSSIIKQPRYTDHWDIKWVSKDNWGGLLQNPEQGSVKFNDTAWEVAGIVNRKCMVKEQRVKYQVKWKSCNGRVFPE